MRPIEFRAYDKIAGVMVYPVVVYETQDHVGFSSTTFERCYDQNRHDHLETGDGWYYLFDMEITQYTGLKDENGKKIFEGDILESDLGLSDYHYVVEWVFAGFQLVTYKKPNSTVRGISDGINQGYFEESDNVTVIGNIYENGELINEHK